MSSGFTHKSKSSNERAALTERLMFLGQMTSTETALFHQAAAEKNGLNITDSKTLSVLMQEGAMTAGELAVRLSLSTGAITSVIDRLEAAGYARRRADPADRRRVIIELQPTHLKKLSNPYESIGKAFRKLLDAYSIDQLRFLVDYYEVALEHTKSEIAKLAQHHKD